MGQRTVLDAFNAAAGFTGQALGHLDEMKRNEADAFIRNCQMRLQEKSAMYIHNVENGIISADDDDFLPGWETESVNLLTEAMKGSKNPYTRKALEYMFSANDARMRPALESARRKVEIERALAMDGDTIARNSRSGMGSVGDRAGFNQEIIDRQFLNGIIGLGKYIADSKGAFYGTYFSELKRRIDREVSGNNARTVADLHNIVRKFGEEIADAGLEIFDAGGGWEGQAGRPTEGFQRTQIDTAAIKNKIMEDGNDYAAQAFNGFVKQKWQEADAEMSMLWNQIQAFAKFNPENTAGIEAQVRRGINALNGIGKDMMNPDDRNKYTGWLLGLLGSRASGGSSRGGDSESVTAMRNIMSRTTQEVLNAWATGRESRVSPKDREGNYIIENSLEERFASMEKWAIDFGKSQGWSEADVRLAFGEEMKFEAMWNAMTETIKKVRPDIDKAIPNIEAMVRNSAKRLSEADQDNFVRQINNDLYGYLMDFGLQGMSPDFLINRAREIADKALSNQLALMNAKDQKAVGTVSEANLIKWTKEAHGNPEAITRIMGNDYYVGHAGNYEQYSDIARNQIILTKNLKDKVDSGEVTVRRVDWLADPKNRNDVLAVPVIEIKGAGAEDGLYYYDVETKNGKEVMVLKRQGSGEAVYWGSGMQAASERGRGQRQAQIESNYKANAQEMAKGIISASTAAERLKIFDQYAEIHFQNDIDSGSPGNLTYLKDELYMRGIDPETMEPVKTITQQRYDELLRRHPERRQDIEKLSSKRNVLRSGMPLTGDR